MNSLRVSNNKLDNLDVSNNLDLTTLDISNTGLGAIDVSKNNGLVEFDLTSNPDLECVKLIKDNWILPTRCGTRMQIPHILYHVIY